MSTDENNQYPSVLDDIWAPSEQTQARLRRLRELEEQRRQRDASSGSPPTRMRRFPSAEPIRRTRLERRAAEEEGSKDTTSADNDSEKEESGSSRQLLRSQSEDVTSTSEKVQAGDAGSKSEDKKASVSGHIEALDSVPDDTQAIYDKIKELEEKRKQGAIGSGVAGSAERSSGTSGMTARERFFQTYNSRSSMANRDQNRSDQIRSSRLRRRMERSRGGRYSSLTGLDHLRMNIDQDISEEGSEAKASSNVRDSSSSRKSTADACAEAFGSLFPLERGMQRVEELEQIRKRTQQDFENQNSETRLQRASSLQPETLSSSLMISRYNSFDSQTSNTYDPIIYRGPLTRSASSDRLVQLREEINLTSSNFTPSLGSSFTSSILPNIPGSPLQIESGDGGASTDSTTDEQDSLPVYMEGSVQGMPFVDSAGLTHWLGPTSPKYKELYSANKIVERRRSRDTSGSGFLGFVDGASRREAYASSMFPDHFLAPCFEKKFSVEERCEMIRKQIYESDIGKSILAKMGERSPPDGASKDVEAGDTNTENEIVSSDEQVRES